MVCTVTGHGLKDPDTALLPRPSRRSCRSRSDAAAARAGGRWACVTVDGRPRSGSGSRRRRRTSGRGSTTLGPRPGALRRGGRRRRPDGLDGRGRPGPGPACPATSGISSSVPCVARSRCSATPPRAAPALPQRIPHARGLGSSAAAVVAGAAAAAALAGRDVAAEGRCVAAATAGHGGARGQRRRRACSEDSSSRGITTAGSTLYGSMRTPALRPSRSSRRSNRPPPRRARAAARHRFRSRTPRSPEAVPRSLFSLSPSVLACCCPPPRTGCTRSTGGRPIRSRRLWSTRSARQAFRP